MNEEWREVEDGFYEISNFGSLRRKKKAPNGIPGKIIKPANCGGYLRYAMSIRCKKVQKSAHRMVAQAFIPNPDNLPEVNHLDCNKHNNCASNLEWCSRTENIRHAFRNKRYNCRIGERTGNAKLDADKVLEMVALRDQGLTLRQIGDKFNVQQTTVCWILKGGTWSHVTGIKRKGKR